jgi:hypothetical protein
LFHGSTAANAVLDRKGCRCGAGTASSSKSRGPAAAAIRARATGTRFCATSSSVFLSLEEAREQFGFDPEREGTEVTVLAPAPGLGA